MDEAQFWQIIEATKPFGPYTIEAHYDRLLERVSGLPESEILDYSRLFHAQLQKANSWELWDAAYIVNGGCGDDDFQDFKAGLVAQGRTVFQSVLDSPEFLAQYLPAKQLIRGESILFLPTLAYRIKVYGTQEEDARQLCPDDVQPQPPIEPSGSSVGEDAEPLRNRFPKLFETFWH